jgi:hypothetical protein
MTASWTGTVAPPGPLSSASPRALSPVPTSRRRANAGRSASAVSVGEVADDLAHRRRQLADHRGHGEDLIVGGQARVLEQVHHLDPVVTGQVLLAGAL